MAKYQRKIDGIDPVRGDTLMLKREDIAPLFVNEIPRDATSEMLYQLCAWFCGGDEPRLDDPFQNAYLQTLVSRQKDAVWRYIEGCKAKSPKGSGEGDISQLVSTQGDIRQTIKESKQKEVNEVKRKFTSTNEGVACPSVAPPVVTDGGEVIRIRGKDYSPRQALAMLAPRDYFGHLDSEEEDRERFARSYAKATDEEVKEFLCLFVEGGFSAEELGLPKDASNEAFSVAAERRLTALREETARKMIAFRKEYGNEVLGRVMWRLDCRMSNEPSDENVGALTWARRVCETLEFVARALKMMRRT